MQGCTSLTAIFHFNFLVIVVDACSVRIGSGEGFPVVLACVVLEGIHDMGCKDVVLMI